MGNKYSAKKASNPSTSEKTTTKSKDSKNLILLGPPGCGKGTQSKKLVSAYNLCHISTGDLLRLSIQNKTTLGLKAQEKLEKGQLVDDEIVLSLVNERLDSPECLDGFLLDGFPRTITQAKELDKMLMKRSTKIDTVIYFEVPEATLIARVCGRMIHPGSGRIYHKLYNPSKVEGVDDITNEPLIVRKDDTEDALLIRLKEYKELTAPLIEYYTESKLLVTIDGSKEPQAILEDISECIKKEKSKDE